jgi:tetratricopeptide (TPR) repeat protein
LGRSEDKPLILALLAVSLLYCLTPVYSENIFWHMRNGEDILDTGTVRTVDTLTWTMSGRLWIQQEWLAEVAFAGAWRLAGPAGLMVIKTLVVLGSVALAAGAAMRKGARGSAVVVVAVLWFSVTQARWFERPHIFTDLFFALYLFLLAGKPLRLWKSLLLFVPLQVLWVNTHAGFVMGPFLLALPALDAVRGKDRKLLIHHIILPAAALAASGMHPNGFASLSYLPGFLSQPLFRDSIREWWSPFDPRYGTARTAVTLIALGVLSAAAFLARRNRAGFAPSAVAMLAALFAASLFAARNMELLALASIAAVSPLLGRVLLPFPVVLLAISAAIPPLFGLPREFGPPRRFGPGMAWEIYPVGLADFIEGHNLLGRPFNTNEISGYLQYRFGERMPLFMDGRCLLYPEHFYAEYLLLAQSPDSTDAGLQMGIIQRSNFELALFDWPRQRGSIANLLAELPNWTPVYWDSLTIAYAAISYLDSTGQDSLAFELVDPLSPEELFERPLNEIPARLLPEMLRASRMRAGGDLPSTVGCCLAWRSGNPALAVELCRAVRSTELRDALSRAMAADTSAAGISPQVSTLLVWALVDSGRWVDARAEAERTGDASLAAAVALAAPQGAAGLEPEEPPPWVPPDVFPAYFSGQMTAGESTSVMASALLATGRGGEASALASSLEGPDVQARPWALAVGAMVLGASGDDAGAILLSERALDRNTNPFTLLARGRVESLAGRYASAAAFFARAAALAPAAPDIRLELAASLWRTGRLEDSAAQYGLARESGSALPPSAFSRIGWAAVLPAGPVDSPAGAGQD